MNDPWEKKYDEGDWNVKGPCLHREHQPPMHICLRQGQKLVHVCPGCGKRTVLKGPPVIYLCAK